jgi:hypothetical protein
VRRWASERTSSGATAAAPPAGDGQANNRELRDRQMEPFTIVEEFGIHIVTYPKFSQFYVYDSSSCVAREQFTSESDSNASSVDSFDYPG